MDTVPVASGSAGGRASGGERSEPHSLQAPRALQQ